LDVARFQTEHYSGRAVLDQERARIRAMHDEAIRLEHAANHAQIALSNAISAINTWLPTEPPTPVQSAPAPVVEPTKRKRLFERKTA
jgi:hypothetical protein